MSVFQERLKELRSTNGISQKTMSVMLDMTVNAYQKYEYGTREPSYETLIKIADYFDVPVDFLLGRGLFANWDIVLEYQDEIFASIESLYPFPADFKLSALPEGKIMRLVAALIERVELVEDKLNIYYLI